MSRESAQEALSEARASFLVHSDSATAAFLLETASDALENDDMSERDFSDDVRTVTRWLKEAGSRERAARGYRPAVRRMEAVGP